MKIKKLFKKKTAIVVGSIALVLALGIGCFVVFRPVPPRGMSAEQTIAYYFKQYNARNLRGMQSVSYRDLKASSYQFPFLLYAKLISCEERRESAQYYYYAQKWDSVPVYDFTVCWVTYEVKHWGGDQGFDGPHSFYYYLVKETKDSNWMIVSWGNA